MKIKYLSILPVVAVFVLSGFSLANAQSDVFTQNLYYGLQNNSQVTQLQEFLTSQNLYSGPITGNFYFLTLGAVKAFQTQQGITPAAGYFGPITMAAVNKIADAVVSASNNEAVTETGTSTPPVVTASTTPQLQLAALMQEVALLEQQLQAQQSSTQVLQQIAQNTTPVATTPTPTPTQPQTFTPAPTASITVNGSANSISIPYNTATTISWTSTNANSCNISPTGWTGISRNQSTGNLTASQTYTISCSGAGGSTSDSVTVNVASPSVSAISTPQPLGTCALTISQQPNGVYGTWGYTNSNSSLQSQYFSTPGWQGNMDFQNANGTWIFFDGVNAQGISQSTMFYNNSLTGTGINTASLDSATQFKLTYPDGTVCYATAQLSGDDTLGSLNVNGAPVSSFIPSTLSYNYALPPGTTAAPIVVATTNNTNATDVINQATSPTGSATVLVTAQNGTKKQTYTINFSIEPRLAVTATQNVGQMIQVMGNSEDLGDITLTANGQGSVTLHSLNITFSEGNNNQGAMTAFLTSAYGFELEDGSVDVTSPIANGGLAAAATDGSFAVATTGNGGVEVVSWVFPNNNLVISPGSPVTLHLWGNIGNFNDLYGINYPVTASIVAPSDIQYYDNSTSPSNLLPNETPVTIYSVTISG